MPFISDDFEWKWVDDQEPYDKRRFVVVRKLRMMPNIRQRYTLPISRFSVGFIRENSEHFGDIESIEILPDEEYVAHVTFVSDHSAYLMQSKHDEAKKVCMMQPFWVVQPADTWEQPREHSDSPAEVDVKQTSGIFKLNEDCLLHLFMFLDVGSLVKMADVCKLFNRLIHRHCFPRIRKYEMSCDSELAQTRRELLCIGRHITDLTFLAHYSWKPIDDCNTRFRSDNNERTSKFLRLVVQNVGQNIRRAFLKLVLNPARIRAIAPILLNLESLEMHVITNTRPDPIDLPTLCPNLIEFKSNLDIPIQRCKPWPSLRHLSVQISNFWNTIPTIIPIIQQNPQLTGLELVVCNGDDRALYTAITQHLTGLEKLTITCFSLTVGFVIFGQLPHLREINLKKVSVNSLDGVINQLPLFANLRKIGLSRHSWDKGRGNYEKSLVDLMKRIPLLEKLELSHMPMKEETFFDVVRFGKHLKTLHIHSCGLDFSDDFISKSVNVLKCYRLESNEALQLWLSEEDFDKLDAAKNNEHSRYLKINGR